MRISGSPQPPQHWILINYCHFLGNLMGKDSLSNCCFDLWFSDCDIYIFIHRLLFLLLSITCTYSLPIFLASGLFLWIDKIFDFLILEENVMCKTSHPVTQTWMSTTGINILWSGKLPRAPAAVLVLPKNEQTRNRSPAVGAYRTLLDTTLGGKEKGEKCEWVHQQPLSLCFVGEWDKEKRKWLGEETLSK